MGASTHGRRGEAEGCGGAEFKRPGISAGSRERRREFMRSNGSQYSAIPRIHISREKSRPERMRANESSAFQGTESSGIHSDNWFLILDSIPTHTHERKVRGKEAGKKESGEERAEIFSVHFHHSHSPLMNT
jgi:hypothetical protein